MKTLIFLLSMITVFAANATILHLTCSGKLAGKEATINFYSNESSFSDDIAELIRSNPDENWAFAKALVVVYSGKRILSTLGARIEIKDLLNGGSELILESGIVDHGYDNGYNDYAYRGYRLVKFSNDDYRAEALWIDMDVNTNQIDSHSLGTLRCTEIPF